MAPRDEPPAAIDPVLAAAASHLAGLGRGMFHRVDLTKDGLLLDGVPLRGVTHYAISRELHDQVRLSLELFVTIGSDE